MVVLLADTGVPLDQAGCIIPEHRDSDATGLMTAASLGHNTVVEFLIGKGVTVDKKKSCGKTALMFAAQGNHIKTVKLLLDAGAAIEATDNQGRTPLHQALECCSLNAAGYLMLRGADPSKIKNRTAIMDEGIEQIQEYRERLEDNIRIALESSS
jgi:ankyrin repeat protein